MGAASDLLTNYQHVIDDLRLVTGDNGVFDVRVDDELVYSKAQTGRHAESGEVLELFTDHIGSDVHRYGENEPRCLEDRMSSSTGVPSSAVV